MQPQNPFLAARDEWDNRLSNQAASRANWRLFALALLLLDILLSAGLYRLASTSRITPYVVELDRHGQTVSVGPADRLEDPLELEPFVRHELGELVVKLRTVLGPAAAAAQRKSLAEAYAFLGSGARGRVGDYFKRHNPFAAHAELVTVDVTSILRLEKDVWQIAWSETRFGFDGSSVSEEPWQAILHVAIAPPKDPDQFLVNPLGLVVTQLDWTRIVPTNSKEIP